MVDKRSVEAFPLGEVFMVIEVAHVRSKDKGSTSLLVSLPGREGTMRRTWLSPYGVVDGSQLVDMQAYLANMLAEGLMAWTGVQSVLGE